jgi:hypothetical protein
MQLSKLALNFLLQAFSEGANEFKCGYSLEDGWNVLDYVYALKNISGYNVESHYTL